MAMTKAEKLRVEELEIALALRWPAHGSPLPMSQDEIEAAKVAVTPRDQSVQRGPRMVAIGWFHNSHNQTVSQGWTDRNYQSRSNITGDSASRINAPMFNTKQKALMAMRWELSRAMAKQLHAVDALIATPASQVSQ